MMLIPVNIWGFMKSPVWLGHVQPAGLWVEGKQMEGEQADLKSARTEVERKRRRNGCGSGSDG